MAGSANIISDAVPGTTSILTITNLTRGSGTLVNFTGEGTALNNTTNQIIVSGVLTPAPTVVTNGYILPYAEVTGPTGSLDFASVASASAPYNITAFTGYVTESLASATNSMDVVKVTATDSSLSSSSGSPAAVLIDGDNITIGGGGVLNLATGALLVTGAATTGDTINTPINFASTSGEGMIFSNSNPTSGNAAVNITGVISNSANGGLTIGGSGTIELSGADTYTGVTTLGSGTLVIDNNSAFGATSNVLEAAGGTIESGSSGGITITNPVQLNTGGVQGIGALTYAGSNPLTLGGVISGLGGLTLDGTTAGPLTFTGSTNSTFSGILTVNTGTLLLAKTGTSASSNEAMATFGNVYINGGTIQQITPINEFGSSDSANVTISSTDAVQTLTFSAPSSSAPTGGTFTLVFANAATTATTAPITYSSVAATLESNIQAALNVLSTVGGGNSFVTLPTTSANGSVSLMVVFDGVYAGLPQNTMTVGSSALLPSGSVLSPPVTTTAGEHGTLAIGPNTAEIDTLDFINGGDVTMTTGALSFYDFSGCIQTFAEPLVPTLPISASNPLLPSTAEIIGGTTTITAYTNNGSYPVNIQSSGGTLSNPQQAIALTNVTGGNFTLTFNGTATTAAITYNTATATLASNIQTALNALTAFSAVATASVAVSGGIATVTFLNVAAGTFVPQLTANIAPTSVIQNLTFPAGITGGIFTLTFTPPGGTATTSSLITYSTSTATLASNIQAALTTLGATTSLATVTATSATSVNITFQGADAGGVVTSTSGVTAASGLAINQKQTIAFTSITGGTFELAYSSTPGTTATTPPITFSTATATLASNISSALNNLSTIGSGNVSVSVSSTTATITFQGALAGLPETNLFTVIGSPAVNAVQNIAFAGSPTNGGKFTLTFVTPAGTTSTSTAVAYSTSTATLATNIQTALTSVGITTSLATVTAVSNTSVNVTFQNGDGGGVIQLANTLSGSNAAAAAVPAVNAVQTLAFPAAASGGTFTVAFNSVTSGPINYSTSLTVLASGIQTALNGLSSISGTGSVTVLPISGTSVGVTFGGGGFAGVAVTPLVSVSGVTANAAYTVSFTGSPTSGTFQLKFNGSSTANINYGTNPGTMQANMQNALDALATIGAGNTQVLVNAGATSATITFQNADAALPETPITATAVALSAGAGISVTPSTSNGFAGLSGAATSSQTFNATTTTTGTAGVAAVTGIGTGGITVTFSQTGSGLVGATSPTSSALVANTGLLGLVGGSNGQTITISATQIGAGLTGTNPAVNVYTVNPGFFGDMVVATQLSGSYGMVKMGAGTLTFAGTVGNNYTFATNVNEGEIVFAKQGNVAAITGPLVIGDYGASATVKVISNFSQLNGQNIYVNSGATFDLTQPASVAAAGTTTGQTIGTLNISGGTVQTGTNTLTLGGDVTAVAIGASPGVLAGKVDLGQNNRNFFALDATTASGTTFGLDVTAVISSASGTFGITKMGAGTLNLEGTAANTYTGATTVNEGTLLLNQTGGVAVPGTLVVGDGVGGSGINKVDIARLGASNEIATTPAVTVNNSGLLDLNSNSNTIGSLTMSGGTVTTETGTLTLGGNVAGFASITNITPATINGNLSLGTAVRTFDIQQGSLPTTLTGGPQADMVINAVISGTGGGINKIGDPGTLLLTAANTYTGATTVSFGSLFVDGTLSGSSAVTTTGNGVLGGTAFPSGSAGATVGSAAGTVNPGDSVGGVGVLTINSAIGTPTTLDLSNSGNLTLEINGFATPGVSYDQLKLTGLGILKLGPTSTLTLDLAGLSGAGSDGKATGVIQFNGLEGGQFGAILTSNNPQGLVPIVTYNANSIDVSFAGPATHFGFTFPGGASVTAGSSFVVTVTALDQFNGPAPSYAGTVHFTSSDLSPSVVLPGTTGLNNVTLTNGIGTFSATLITSTINGVTPNFQSITGTDITAGQSYSGITGSAAVTVNPASIFGFKVSVGSNTVAGQLVGFSVTAQDQYANTIPTYAGTIHFSSSDPNAQLSNDATLTGGVGGFAASLHTTGTQTITASQLGSTAVSGISNSINVTAGAVKNFVVTVPPTNRAAGQSFLVTVTAEDAFGNLNTAYTGTVHFTSSDGKATLPADSTLVSGSGTFSYILQSAGNQTVTASDLAANPNITATAPVTVAAGAINKFAVTIPGSGTTPAGSPLYFEVIAEDTYGNTVTGYTGTIHFSSTDGNPAAGRLHLHQRHHRLRGQQRRRVFWHALADGRPANRHRH